MNQQIGEALVLLGALLTLLAAMGVVVSGFTTAGWRTTITFGVPVDPLLQMPFTWGEIRGGRSGTGSCAVASSQGSSAGLR